MGWRPGQTTQAMLSLQKMAKEGRVKPSAKPKKMVF